jgi:hypothetical protein
MHLKLSSLLFFFLIFFTNCEKDILQIGDVNVVVSSNTTFGPVKGARVFTNPSSIEGETDNFGSALLKGLSVGSYEIFASLPNIGTGKATVSVKNNELVQVNIQIIQGVNVTFAPTVKLVLPSLPAEFSFGETVKFSATATDDKTQSSRLKVQWMSDKDGLLNSTTPDANGNIGFETNKLSRNLHVITLTVEDEDKQKTVVKVNVNNLAPKAVELAVPTKNTGKIDLAWSLFQGENFKQYEVYRSDDCNESTGKLLATISDRNNTKFTDAIPPILQEACYYVKVLNTDGYSRTSNIQKVSQPSGTVFNFTVKDALKHPTKSIIYLISEGDQKIVKYDYSTNTILSSTNLPGKTGISTIGNNGFGVEIYVPCTDGWVYVYNAETMALATSINAGLPASSVAINGMGTVIVCVRPSPWWEKPVRTFRRDNGLPLGSNNGSAFDGSIIRMISGKNEALTISSSVSPIDMDHLKLNTDGSLTLTDDKYHGDYPLDPFIFKIAPSGEYAVTSLSGAVYTANSSMTYKGQIQRGALSFSDFEFSANSNVIYAATQNRKSIQIAKYPELTRDNEILTKGLPKFIFRDNNKLISFSISAENPLLSIVEILDIP